LKQKYPIVEFNGKKYYLRPNGYYCSQFLDGGVYLHRAVWEHHNGPIPPRHQIHHKDENKVNNDISNLECVDISKHRRDHMIAAGVEDPEKFKRLQSAGKEAARAWHKSEEGRAWHRENALKMGFGKIKERVT
jgi:hypothetical protein